MPLLHKRNLFGFLTIIFVLHTMLSAVPAQAQLRNIKVGDKMPEFSLPVLAVPSSPNDSNEVVFTYKHNRERVLGLVFLSVNQKQSQRVVADIEKIVKELDKKNVLFDFRGVMSGQPEKKSAEFPKEEPAGVFPILLDEEYNLWGKLGVIAKPTVLIIGKDDRILWVKAGYGYDFSPSLLRHLNHALGISEEKVDGKLIEVRTLKGDSTRAKVKRHLTIASRLEKKGRLESAITEAHKAMELDPNSVDAALAIGELFCRTDQSEKALNAVEKIKPVKRFNIARVQLISGWAKRQLGDLESAEKLLLETIAMHPKSSRAFYELGKIYQTKTQTEKAMQAFYKALTLVFVEPVEINISH